MKNCPKCHKELSYDLKTTGFCGFCGYKFEQPEEKPNPPKKPSTKKKTKGKNMGIVLAVLLVICLAAGGAGIYLYNSSPSVKYKKAIKEMEEEHYVNASKIFAEIPDYEDSTELYKQCHYIYGRQLMDEENYEQAITSFEEAADYEDSKELQAQCQHLYDVKNDTTMPEISGLNKQIDIHVLQRFNLNKYVANHISITDDVTSDIKDYIISCNDTDFDKKTGIVYTNELKLIAVYVTAKDEAGNSNVFKFDINVEPIHLTKKSPHPTIYDGDMGTIKIKSLKHGQTDWGSAYIVTFDVYNKTSKDKEVFLPSNDTYADTTELTTYGSEDDFIKAHKKGTTDTYIYDKDIKSKNVEKFKKIVTSVCVADVGHKHADYAIPIEIDRDAFE